MKINDPRIIIVDGSKFERARIIQGSLIYLILGAFSVGAILHNESWGVIILATILLVYIFNLYVYSRKTQNFKGSSLAALCATLSMPTSMIG